MNFEDVFLHFLGTPKRLVEYIDADTDLSAYINNHYSAYIKTARFLLPGYPNLVKEGQTMDWVKILKVLSRRRPDLWCIIITHRKGMEWIRSQKFKDFLQ